MALFVDIEKALGDFRLKVKFEVGEETLAHLKEAAGVSNTRAAAAGLIGKRAMSCWGPPAAARA